MKCSTKRVGCAALMKKCVQCRASIDKVLPFIVCCGGTGKCTSSIENCRLAATSISHIVNRLSTLNIDCGFTVLVIAPPPPTSQPVNVVPAGALMNNGARDMSSGDLQKLQQQLQDIKEQVSISLLEKVLYILS